MHDLFLLSLNSIMNKYHFSLKYQFFFCFSLRKLKIIKLQSTQKEMKLENALGLLQF